MTAQLQYTAAGDGHVVLLGDEVVLIGRARDCDLRFRDDATMSAHHARIVRENERHWVETLDGSDEMLVNGTATQRHHLRHRDRVQCGKTVFEYFDE